MKKYTILGLALSILILGCRKEEINKIDGPALNDIYGEFSILSTLSSSADSVDFSAAETVFFTAEFSKNIEWELKITGENSGAIKYITGNSSVIDESVASWAGSTTELPVFRNENCQVQLTFKNETDTLETAVKIINPKTNEGFLISDFEAGWNPGWSSFIQSGADMEFEIKSDDTSPEKGSYYNMAGTVDWDWLIGYVYFNAAAYDGAQYFPFGSNPDNQYFNIMIYGEPNINTSLLLFQFEEDDNEDGTYDAASEDMYSLEVKIDWVGWKLLSVKYSDIPSLVNGQPAAPNGNGQYNPDRLGKINMLHLANFALGYAKTKVDYIIFTENEPLMP